MDEKARGHSRVVRVIVHSAASPFSGLACGTVQAATAAKGSGMTRAGIRHGHRLKLPKTQPECCGAAARLHLVLLLGLFHTACGFTSLSRPNEASRSTKCAARQCHVRCWTGESVATIEIEGVPVDKLYDGYSDLTRMTEWSPLLESVTPRVEQPNLSVWVMRVPTALRWAAQRLGYLDKDAKLSWEADLTAPGPPLMTWTSVLDESGKLKGLPNAGFEPSGEVEFSELGEGLSTMTLRLRYELPQTAPQWQIALVQSAPIQFVLQNRMTAGMNRFARVMIKEWEADNDARQQSSGAVLVE